MTYLQSVKKRFLNFLEPGDSTLMRRHPELKYRIPVNTGQATQGALDYDATDNSEVYKYYVWVRKGVKVKSDNIASLPIVVRDNEGEAINNHPLELLFQNGNANDDPSELWGAWSTDKDLYGESFFEIVDGKKGGPVELWRRDPRTVAVVPDVSNPLYPRVHGYLIDGKPVGVENVIHWKYFHPDNPFRGLSVIGAVRNSITIDILAQAWSKMLLKKGGRPDWALVAPEGLTSTERQDYKADILAHHQSINSLGDPIILENGVTDIKVLSHPPKDLEWLAQKELSRDEVGAILGVPDKLMGWGIDTYDTEQKTVAALKALWTLTLKPLIDKRDRGLTKYFSTVRAMLEPGQRITTDVSGVGYLQEEFADRLEQGAKLFNLGYTTNQINERLKLGMVEVPWGDSPYVQNGYTQLDDNGNPAAEKQAGTVYGIVKRVKGLNSLTPPEIQEYQTDVENLIRQANAGNTTREQFKDQLTDLTVSIMLATFMAGSSRGQDDLTDEHLNIIAEYSETSLDAIAKLTKDVFDGKFRGDQANDIPARVHKWSNWAWQLHERAKLYSAVDGFLKWELDPTKHNCVDCLFLAGQVHRRSEWLATALWPKHHELFCTGWDCGCGFLEDNGPSRGTFLVRD